MSGQARRPTLGLVLGSEGIRAFAALPAAQFLANQGLGPDLLVGSGGGALIAALIGAGFDLEKVKESFLAVCDKRLFTELDPVAALSLAQSLRGRYTPDSALVNTANLRALYARIFKGLQVEDLVPRTILCATDVKTGTPVTLTSGPVADAVYAAGCPYPLTPPLVVGDAWLADGSYSQPLPVLEAVKAGMDIIVGVYAQDEFALLPSSFGESYLNVIRSFKKALLRSQNYQSLDFAEQEIITLLAKPEKRPGAVCGDTLTVILDAGRKALERKQEDILQAVAAVRIRGGHGPSLPLTLDEPDRSPG